MGEEGWVELSAPLSSPLTEGKIDLVTLKFHPLGDPTFKNGEKNEAVGETLAGWMKFVAAVTRTATQALDTSGFVQYGPGLPGAWSAQWAIIKNSEGYYTFCNRWTAAYMHIENLLGFVQYGTLMDGAWSAQWSLAPVP